MEDQMPENVYKCPFSHQECRTCPVFRGRHAYVVPKEGEEVPEPKILKKVEVDWQAQFREVVPSKVEEAPADDHGSIPEN
jgi:hypothetical protein